MNKKHYMILTIVPILVCLAWVPVACTGAECCDATGCNGNGAVSDAAGGAGAGTSDEAAADALEGPSPDYLASSYGAAAGPQSMAPNMMGDFFGGGIGVSSEGHFHSSSSSGTIPLAGGDRRFKISENNNPRPTDRVFFNFNHFHNALFSGVDGRDHHLNRFTFGVEKTFNGGLGSVELRVPFADGLNSVQDFSLERPVEATEFGDIVLVVKHIIRQRGNRMLTAGLGITIPTGSDASQTFGGETDVLFKNEAVRLQPYLGWLWTPGPCWFVQAFAAADFDTNGHAVLTRDYIADRLVYQGRLHEQSLLYLDALIGRWIYRNPCATCITGIAPVVELHYTTTMEDTANVGGFSNPFNRMDVLDLTAGVHVQLGASSMLSVAGVAPLRQDEEKLFDAEIQLQYNRRF